MDGFLWLKKLLVEEENLSTWKIKIQMTYFLIKAAVNAPLVAPIGIELFSHNTNLDS